MYMRTKPTIALTHPSILLSEHYYRRLWLAVRNIKITRRDWLDEMADMIRDFDGKIVTPDGHQYELPLVDDVFGNDFDMRWLGYYLIPNEAGDHPRSRSRKIERLQLLDLYFRIKHPEVAENFRA